MKRLLMFLLMGVCFSLPFSTLAQSIVWEQTYPLGENIVGLEKADSGFIFFGQSELNFRDVSELVKTDTSGNILWNKYISFDTAIDDLFSFDMVKTQNEWAYYLSGRYRIDGSGLGDYILKVDTKGDTIWTYSYAPFGFYQTTRKLLTLQDKSVLSVGFQEQAGTQEDVFVRRLDSLGTLMWENMYDMPGNQRGFDITEMLDGSLVVAGSSDGDNLIMRIGFDGRLIEDTTINGQGNGSIDHLGIQTNQSNSVILASDSWNGTWYESQRVLLDEEFKVESNVYALGGIVNDLMVNLDSTFYLENYLQPDTSLIQNFDFQNNLISSFQFSADGNIREVNDLISIGSSEKILSGYLDNGSSQDYWIMNIDGLKEEWIPDRCAYQPPVAGFEYEYIYPTLSLRDTSNGGLQYLDTVYTWQWNTSVGTSGTQDSLLVFFDSAVNSSIDIELVISNWYGCTDTANLTLNFDPNGITIEKPLDVKIYPNPVNDILHIEFTETLNQEVLFELYDIQGVKHIQIKSKERLLRTRISGLPKGLYFYRISTESEVKRGTVVKQ